MITYSFKLYNSKRNNYLVNLILIAAGIWNHCIALHKRYYRLYGKSLSANKLKKHITKLKKLPKHEHFNQLGSQAIQDVVERIDRAYKLFFRNHKVGIRSAPPGFKKRIKYKSFTLKQAGYDFQGGNKIRIGKKIFKFFKSRNICGNPKTVTIKRDSVGDLYIHIVTDATKTVENQVRTGNSVGFDFGLKKFLTASDGNDVESPQFFKRGINAIRKAAKNLSSKKRGSNNRKKARLNLARKHRVIANQRSDFHWKLANRITDLYDVICFEDLNLKGMKRLWGRKISDLGFYSFVQKVVYYSQQKGKRVVFVDRFYPSSKTCSDCGFVLPFLELRQRSWTCHDCGIVHDRDRNASFNIVRVGASTLNGDIVRPTSVGKCC